MEATVSVPRAHLDTGYAGGFVVFVFAFTAANLSVGFFLSSCERPQEIRLFKYLTYEIPRIRENILLSVPKSAVINRLQCTEGYIYQEGRRIRVTEFRVKVDFGFTSRRLMLESCTLAGCNQLFNGK
ncbi:hypothetical protein BIW11_13843, partial [Tropilaelaps mercedesae]